MSPSCLSGFFSKTNIQIFELLVDRSFGIRELAGKANCSVGKASQAVKQFQKNKIVFTKNEKNRKVVFLNKENPLTRQLITLLITDKILNSGSFKKIRKNAVSAGIYGSAAEGTIDKLSDIDLWILNKEKNSIFEIGKMNNDLGKELSREVSIKTFTKESLDKLKKKDNIFFNELKYKSKMLFGEEFE